MAIEAVTKEDLELLRMQLLDDFKVILGLHQPPVEMPEGYKTSHVRKILGCSTNKLQALRIAGKLRCKKVGGTIYYKKEDVKKLLNEGF
ncbi:helix-turn-helix domain-containing protein [Flavitalea sp.]|nr:helix-turn-helix domain-containing protein [Flavitalea sp.]